MRKAEHSYKCKNEVARMYKAIQLLEIKICIQIIYALVPFASKHIIMHPYTAVHQEAEDEEK